MKKNPADFSLSSFDSWNLVVEQSLFFFFYVKKLKWSKKISSAGDELLMIIHFLKEKS